MNRIKQNGFTLIELMIVVVIIGVLASIAIPQFLRYQLKAKCSEAPRNIGAIRNGQEAFSARFGKYALAARRGPGAQTKGAWGSDPSSGFDAIGFSPLGSIYFAYSVAVGLPAVTTGVLPSVNTTIDSSTGLPSSNAVDARPQVTDINIQASADLDGVGDHGSYYATDEDGGLVPIPGASGESTF